MYIEELETNFPIGKHTLRVFHDILKGLLAKNCFDASYICLFRFVAFRVTFNGLICWTKRCGLLSRIHLCAMDKTWQTGPNEFVLHFEIVFVVFWHQVGKLVQVVFYTVWLFCVIYTKIRYKFVYWRHWNKSSYGKYTLHVVTWYFKEVFGKNLFRCFIYVFFRFVSFRFTFNHLCCWTQRCGLLSRLHFRVTDHSWQTCPNKSALHFEVVFVFSWHQIGKVVQVVLCTLSVILLKLHNNSS